jgi:hypothetical protein
LHDGTVARVVDGQLSEKFAVPEGAKVEDLQISADGTQVAWLEVAGGHSRLCVNGKPTNLPFTELAGLAISPDGRHTAVVGSREQSVFGLMLDFQEMPNVLSSAKPRIEAKAQLEVEGADRETMTIVELPHGWTKVYGRVSEDGRLLFDSATRDRLSLNGGDVGVGKFLGARSPMTGRAYALMETERPLVVEKALTEVTRVDLVANGEKPDEPAQ